MFWFFPRWLCLQLQLLFVFCFFCFNWSCDLEGFPAFPVCAVEWVSKHLFVGGATYGAYSESFCNRFNLKKINLLKSSSFSCIARHLGQWGPTPAGHPVGALRQRHAGLRWPICSREPRVLLPLPEGQSSSARIWCHHNSKGKLWFDRDSWVFTAWFCRVSVHYYRFLMMLHILQQTDEVIDCTVSYLF